MSKPQQITAFSSPSNNSIDEISQLILRILHAVCLTITEPQGERKEDEREQKEGMRERGK